MYYKAKEKLSLFIDNIMFCIGNPEESTEIHMI